MYSKGKIGHHIPAVRRKEDFPFSYTVKEVEDDENSKTVDFEVECVKGESLKDKIDEALIRVFPFHKYLDKYSKDYIGFNKVSDKVSYLIKINYYGITDTKPKKKKAIKTFLAYLFEFKSEYTFNMVRSLDHLKEILSQSKDKIRIAFDTETEGLNLDEDGLVGLSFSFKNKEGYYMPINHISEFKDYNLGKPVLDFFYNSLTEYKRVDLFNARFDMRVMEFEDSKYDMSKVNIMDVQINSYFSDSSQKKTSLKFFEKHFLGYYRLNLEDTLRGVALEMFNTAMISPENLLFYACQDAISTFELGGETEQFFKEFKLSGQIDQALLYPLMKMENHGIRVDTKFLEEQLNIIMPRLEELNRLIHEQIGEINLNSHKQKEQLFKSFNLDTGYKTKTGNMKLGRDEIEEMISEMEEHNKEIPSWLSYFGERSKLEKLQSTYFNSLFEQAKLHNGRVRINYRNVQTSTGRLSSGSEK